MKTKILLSGIALSLSLMVCAQENPTLENQIKNYTVKIDSIVMYEKSAMNKELDEIDLRFKEGEISDAEKKSRRFEIAQRYEKSINEKVDAKKNELEEVIRGTVKNSVLQSDDSRSSLVVSAADKSLITFRAGKKNKHPKDLLKTWGFFGSGGYLNLTNDSAPLNFFNDSSEIRFGKSESASNIMKFERQIGQFTSPVFVHFGLGVRSDSYFLEKSKVFAQSNNQLFIMPFSTGQLKYSSLNAEYIEAPLDISFVLNPKYIEYEGERYLDATKSQLRIGFGIYGDVKIGNRIRYKYSNEVSSKNVMIQRVEDGLSPFLFGAKLSFGYGGFNFYLKKDITPVFDGNAQLNNKHALQIGIELISFIF